MIKYLAKRFALLVLCLFLILFVVCLMMMNLPGNGKRSLRAYSSEHDALDRFYEKINAPENVVTKFVRYSYDLVVHGHFGSGEGLEPENYKSILMVRAGLTLRLTLVGFVYSVVLGIPLGILSAFFHKKWPDNIISGILSFFSAIPTFCLALGCAIVFCLWLRILPLFGYTSWQNYVMPAIVLGSYGAFVTAKMSRAATLEVLNSLYITALTARGIKRGKIIFKHVMRNILVPVISSINNVIVIVLCNTIVVENYFTIPGLGQYILKGIGNRDAITLLSATFFITLTILVVNFLTDIAYFIVNPRLRDEYRIRKAVTR